MGWIKGLLLKINFQGLKKDTNGPWEPVVSCMHPYCMHRQGGVSLALVKSCHLLMLAELEHGGHSNRLLSWCVWIIFCHVKLLTHDITNLILQKRSIKFSEDGVRLPTWLWNWKQPHTLIILSPIDCTCTCLYMCGCPYRVTLRVFSWGMLQQQQSLPYKIRNNKNNNNYKIDRYIWFLTPSQSLGLYQDDPTTTKHNNKQTHIETNKPS